MRDRTTEPARERAPTTPAPAPAPAPESSPLLTMQRQVGNAAVVAMLDGGGTAVQAKLEVGAVDDPAEAEADRMADQVLRSLQMGDADAADDDAPVSRLSRMVRRSGRPAASGAPGHGLDGGPVDAGVEQQIQRARGGGSPLDADTRSQMESGFGADFSTIRIHSGGEADTLSKSLNAKAFTTGNDIFFSGGQVDRKVLAHELAHTVQQGAAPVRRFIEVAEFAKLTYQSMLTAKSTAQTTIEGFLAQYKVLGTPVAKKGEKTPAKTGITIPDDNIDNALELLTAMQRVAQAYIGNKEKTDAEGVAAKDKKTKVLGEDRNKRVEGFKWFLTAVSQEIVKLQNRKTSLKEGTKQAEISVDTSGKQKVVDKYEGNLGTILKLCGSAIGAVCSVNGDQSDLEIKVTIPVPPNFFVGGTLRFGARRDDDMTTVTCDALFTGGAKLGIANINAGLGGYFKIIAKDPATAMKLMSYGMYRRCKESSVIPASVAASIWGEKGDETGDKWSKRVEGDELGKGSKQSVEMGGMAEVGADAGVDGLLKAEGAASLRSGKKYDAASLVETKGGAGADNTKGDNWYAQQSTGSDVGNVEVRAKLDFECPFADTKAAVDSKLQIAWRDNKEKDAKGKEKGAEVDLVFWEMRGNMRFPSSGFAGKVASGATTFGLWIKDQANGEFKKLDAKGVATQVVTKGYTVADASTTGLHGVGFADYIEQKLKSDATPKPDPNAKKVDPDAGRIGVEFAYTYKSVKGQPMQMFEIRQLVENSVKVPEILKITLQKRKRIVGVQKTGAGGGWSFIA